MFSPAERAFLASARVARLATADGAGRPHVVPVCFALDSDGVVTPVDEKPKDADPDALRRVRDVRSNPHVALVADRYVEDWDALGWVQVRGTASVLAPGDPARGDAVAALREKYDQYATHDLESRPLLRVDPGHVVSWGRL
jgi:PPOX class probable F420-dependent enzyme